MPTAKEPRLTIDPDKAAAALCRRHFYFFVQEFWGVIIDEDPVWNWHIKYLCEEAEKIIRRLAKTKEHPYREEKDADVIVNIPPGTSKSTIWTIMLPAWAWAIDPSLRILTISYSDDLATEHAVKSRDVIQSDKYMKYFPDVAIKKDKNNKTNYENTRNGQRRAAGLSGTITGIHAHLILIDDPLNPKQAASEQECNNANFLIDNTLSTRKVDKSVTVTILIMQRLSANDPTAHLLEKVGKKVVHYCLPAEEKDGVVPSSVAEKYSNGLLDPIRLGTPVLTEARIDLGAAGYAGQFSQKPVPAGGLIWQKWLKEVPDELFPHRDKLTNYGSDWDLAYTKDDVNAASAYITAGKLRNDIYIDDIGWDWLEFPQLIRWMKSRLAPHYIESKASGKSAKQTLVMEGINAIEVQVKGGTDKVARAQMATPTAEAGRVYIRASLADKMYNDSKQGILFFPRGKYKDLADTLAQCIQRLSTAGVVMSDAQSMSESSDEDMLSWLND